MTSIAAIRAREVLDSRGNPTVEVELTLDQGTVARAAVPSGASTGVHEAVELRDGDETRFGGKGVLKAVANVNGPIAKALLGMSPFDQGAVDRRLIELDGTDDKSHLGANALLGVSLALAHAAARAQGKPLYRYLAREAGDLLPVPMFNILNGGRHARGSTDFQEFMIVPAGVPSLSEAIRCGAEVYQALLRILQREGLNTNVGDEGGLAPSLSSNAEAVEVVVMAIQEAGYSPGQECLISLDVAASELYHDGRYVLSLEEATYSGPELVEYYARWVEHYPIVSIEDGLAEDDWEAWLLLTQRLGHRVQIVGDDLYTTNVQRIHRGIEEGSSNAVLIKLNQIGTITEALEAVELTRQAGWRAIISHRSGETEDTTIADLAVATGVGQIKAGAPCRGERVAKYNRLLRIEEELGDLARYAGTGMYHVSRT